MSLIQSKIKSSITMAIFCSGFYIGCVSYKSKYSEENLGGKAKIVFDCGDTYEGDYINGEMHGSGIYEWNDHPNFLRFEGNFKNGQPYFGIITLVNGRRFELNFNGVFKLTGPAQEIFPNNSRKAIQL